MVKKNPHQMRVYRFSNLLGHKGYMTSYVVQFGGHVGSLAYITTIYKPKPGGYGGGERYAILDKR